MTEILRSTHGTIGRKGSVIVRCPVQSQHLEKLRKSERTLNLMAEIKIREIFKISTTPM